MLSVCVGVSTHKLIVRSRRWARLLLLSRCSFSDWFWEGLGWCLTWFYAKAQRAELEARRDADAEKIEWIKDSQKALRETFEALASKSLRQNAHDFSGRINRNLTAHAQQIDVLKTTLETNVNQNLTSHAQYIDVVKVALETNVKQNLTSHAQQIDVVKVCA